MYLFHRNHAERGLRLSSNKYKSERFSNERFITLPKHVACVIPRNVQGLACQGQIYRYDGLLQFSNTIPLDSVDKTQQLYRPPYTTVHKLSFAQLIMLRKRRLNFYIHVENFKKKHFMFFNLKMCAQNTISKFQHVLPI